MSDILVFSPPAFEDFSQAFENYNLGSVCGWLRDEGYDFDQRSLFVDCRYLNQYRFRKDVVDLSVFEEKRVARYLRGEEDEDITREANKLADLLSIDDYETIIIPVETDQVVSVRDPRIFMALPILKERARDDQLVIIGGSEFTEGTDVERFSFVDYAVDGDVEIPLGNIFAHEFEGEDLVVEPGVRCVRDGEVLRGEPYQHPLDMKPKPYFDKEILDRYADVSVKDVSILPYRLGHGCAQDCSYCTYFKDQSYQYKSVDKVVRELKELTEELDTRHVWFADQNLFNDPDHILELVERFQEEDMDIKWAGLGIILSRDQEFFDTLAEGGCKAIYHGVESFSNSVLHRMRKHQTRSMIEETLEKEYRAGIKPFAGLITDYVDETWDEYFETVDFVRENRHLMYAEATSLRIYPSERQPLYRNPEKFGIEIQEPEDEEEDWRNLDYEYNLPFKDSRGEMGTIYDERRIKKRFLQRLATLELFVKNYARDHPITFLRLMLRKLYTKDYSDVTHEYV